MRVVATAVGFDGKTLRQPGEEFDLPDDAGPGDWFKKVEKRRKRGDQPDDAQGDQGEAGDLA